jgi:hypothetical protein
MKKLSSFGKGNNTQILYAIAAILVGLWLVGEVNSYRMDGFLHLLLVIALIVVVFNFFQSKKN